MEEYLAKEGRKLPRRTASPFTANYRLETDTTLELCDTKAAYYLALIGVLRWMVELGRVDICVEASLLSSHMALPWEGHLLQLYQVFAFLKSHHNFEMVFDPSELEIDRSLFVRQDWAATVYGDSSKEELPANMPESRGQGFIMSAYVDSDHADDVATRRSRTGFLVFLNSALIFWMSKKQTSIETISYGSE